MDESFNKADKPKGPTKWEDIPVACPYCRQCTTSLRTYNVLHRVIFAILFVSSSRAEVTACPSCTRSYLGMRMLYNIPTANFIWPVLIFLPYTYFFLKTFGKGHSDDVVRGLRTLHASWLRQKKAGLEGPIKWPPCK